MFIKLKAAIFLKDGKLNKNSIYTLSKIKGEQNVHKEKSTLGSLILRICNLFSYPYFKNKIIENYYLFIVKDLIKKQIQDKNQKK